MDCHPELVEGQTILISILRIISSIVRQVHYDKIVQTKKVILSGIAFFLLFNITVAQNLGKQTNFWPFGNGVVLNFNTNPPTLDSVNALSGSGSINYKNASMCDYDGNLLFYSTGGNIYNKNFQIMDNGIIRQNMYEDFVNSLIVPQPYNDSIYYLFSIKKFYTSFEESRIQYSVINIKANNGLGKVVSKNNIITDSVTNEITGVISDSNGKLWISTRRIPSSSILIELTENSISSITQEYNMSFYFTYNLIYNLHKLAKFY